MIYNYIKYVYFISTKDCRFSNILVTPRKNEFDGIALHQRISMLPNGGPCIVGHLYFQVVFEEWIGQ